MREADWGMGEPVRHDSPERRDDRAKSARPGVPMEHAPEPFPTAPENVVPQRPRVEVLEVVGLQRPPLVVSNAQPPRGLAGRLRRRAFRYPEHEAKHWMLLLTADRVDVRMHRLRRRLGTLAGAALAVALLRAVSRAR